MLPRWQMRLPMWMSSRLPRKLCWSSYRASVGWGKGRQIHRWHWMPATSCWRVRIRNFVIHVRTKIRLSGSRLLCRFQSVVNGCLALWRQAFPMLSEAQSQSAAQTCCVSAISVLERSLLMPRAGRCSRASCSGN